MSRASSTVCTPIFAILKRNALACKLASRNLSLKNHVSLTTAVKSSRPKFVRWSQSSKLSSVTSNTTHATPPPSPSPPPPPPPHPPRPPPPPSPPPPRSPTHPS